jgi:pyrroline-5-carboxylate reductase
MRNATVFIGSGRIVSALLAGLNLANDRARIVIYGRNAKSRQQLKKIYDLEIEKNLRRAVDQAKLLIIAVRPAVVAEVVKQIGPVKRPLLAVSFAAGIPLSNLRSALPRPVKWVRAMPSPASRSGMGLTALAFDRGVSRAERKSVEVFFSKVGPVLEVPESKFDAFTVTYSSSHGYHALAALAAAAYSLGLDRKTALQAAAHGLADGIIAWRNSNISLNHLLNEAATPGGIAAGVMEAMDRAGYGAAVKKGLDEGLRRTRRNARLGR